MRRRLTNLPQHQTPNEALCAPIARVRDVWLLSSTVVFAGMALLFWTLPAMASPESAGVSGLRIADAGGSETETSVAAGTEQVDALFEYVEATAEEIELVVKGRGGIVCFRQIAVYDGEGSARVPIRGASMYPVIAESLASAAREAKRNAKSASTRTFGIQEFLLSSQAGVIRTGYAAETLLAADLPADLRSRAEDALTIVASSLDALETAIALPAEDVDGKQGIAAGVDESLGEAVLASGELQAASDG